MRRILTSLCFLLICCMPLHAQSQGDSPELPDDPAQPGNGVIELLDEIPEPGAPVRIRLRDDALTQVLSNPCAWSVRSGKDEVPGLLKISQGRASDEIYKLTIIDPGKPELQDRIVVLDRGADPVACGVLELSFSSADVLTTVIPAAGPTQQDFSQQGREQLVMQEVGADGVLRIAHIDFSPLPVNRYIRLTIRNGADNSVSEVHCKPTASLPELHEVPVALGSMHSIPAGGGSMWPLLLPANNLPLRKIKIVSEAPGQVRRIRFVRIDDNQHELFREAEMIYADSLSVNGVERTENYLELAGGMSSQQPALVVEDGMGMALPIRSVQAYVAEVFICFSWPAGPSPVLSAIPRSGSAEGVDEQSLPLAGTFSSLSPDPDALQTSADTSSGKKEKAGRSGPGLLQELDLAKYLPKIDAGYEMLLPVAGVLLLAGLIILIAARVRDFRA